MTAATPISRLERNRAWKDKNRAAWLAWNKERNARIAADPELKAKKQAANRASAKRMAAKRRVYDRNRDRVKENARGRVRYRIKYGSLVRGVCLICGAPNADAHHQDYSKPLQIHWLCRLHHKAVHDGRLNIDAMEPINVK
jgi:hypothetical protein